MSFTSADVLQLRGHESGAGEVGLARRAIEAVRVVTALGGAVPDDRQRAVLEEFPGWGPVARLFDAEPSGVWGELADELDDVAGPAMLAAGRIVDTSFFTPAALVEHIYGVLRAAGFTGGSVLDLGCGTGRFLRHAPADLAITMTGLDVDPISAQIARALHRDATIITGELQSVSLPHKRFDAAVGNVPFSGSRIFDSAIGFHGSLHEYFLLRAVAAVRPGGYVVMVTSRHTLDAAHGLSAAVRAHADLLAAVRLPSRYFKAEGTGVVADVVILRVRDGDDARGWQPPTGAATVELAKSVAGRLCRERVSRFWELHPRCVAGQMRLTGFDRSPVVVDAADPGEAVADAFAATEALLVPYVGEVAVPVDGADVRLVDDQGRKEGSVHVVDEQVVRVVDGMLRPMPRASAELRALIALRDAAVALVEAEGDWDRPDAEVEPLRVVCRELYTGYVGRFGHLNRGVVTEGKPDPETGAPRLGWRAATLGGFRSDPDAPIVLALESFDQASGQAGPAPILSRRVNKRPRPVDRAGTAGEALAICLGEGRGLDLDRIAALLSLAGPEAAFDALGDQVFRDPGRSGRAVIARDYLSGNVRSKLREALAAAAFDDGYDRNVAALQAVQPSWLGRDEIRIELGSPFVSAGDVADFCSEVFGDRARVNHIVPLAAWEIEGSRHRLSADAKITYCTPRMDAFELLQVGLNGAAPIIYDEIYDERSRTRRRVRNADQTEAAEQRLAAIGERFSLWVWEDAEREQRIVDRYNQTMNAHVLRSHDGTHLMFPGLSDGIDLWPWQRNFVDQAVSTPGVFAAHEVGLGKTLTAITLAMTLRQFGLANRIGFAVPNHLIEQVTREAYQAWPSGRFLIVTRDDLHAGARRRFVARCATGDWDLVIMTHETFSSIPVPGAAERTWLEDQLSELENYARAERYTGKRIAAAVRALKGRIDRLRDAINDPSALTFPMLGLDYLMIDEADRFRRLPVTSRADGFSLGSSKRALDLLLKVSMLRRANPGRPYAAFFTGTPFTNSLAEAYVWQQFLAPEQLEEAGLSHFDAWAAQFIRYEVLIEVAPDGSGFRSRRRPSVIQNVPELRTMLAGFMSMVRAEGTTLVRPEPVRHTVVVQPSDATRAFMDTLVKRADDLKNRRVDAKVDNMLLICGDGRKVALDPNLVGVAEAASKLEAVAETVADIYHRTRDLTYPGSPVPGAFQLVLCDLGTPRDGDSQSYGRIRSGLIARGVPAGEIRFVHEAATPKAREALFASCRDGAVAVLIGSTPKVGIGTNLQSRLHSLHHVDPTWTAAAWEQRNGRGIRSGNHHRTVGIHSYVCESTFDAFMFGVIERKAKGFEQLYRADGQAREIEDLGDGALSYAELKAAAAGNDLLLRQHELATRIRKLRLAHVTMQQNVRAMLNQAADAESTAGALATRVRHLEDMTQHRAAIADVDLAAAAAAVCDQQQGRYQPYQPWGGGHQVSVRFVSTDPGYRLQLSCGYQPLWAEPLPPKVRRRGAEAVKAWADAWVAAWMGGLDEEIERTRLRVANFRQSAADARSSAGAVDTTEPHELIAARAELAEVNQAITDELDTGDTPRAA